jgi:hypothetical protein
MEDDIEEDEGGIDIEEDKNEIDIKKNNYYVKYD